MQEKAIIGQFQAETASPSAKQLLVIAEQGGRVSSSVHPDSLEKRNTLCSVEIKP